MSKLPENPIEAWSEMKKNILAAVTKLGQWTPSMLRDWRRVKFLSKNIRSKYMPHQGEREKARRIRQMERQK